MDLALAAVGLGHRRVDHLDHHRRDVDARAVALDVGNDRIVGNVEAKVRVDGDLLAAGGHLDVLVVGILLEVLGLPVEQRVNVHRETLNYPRICYATSRNPTSAPARARRPAQQALRRALPVHGRRRRPTLADFVDVPDVYPAGRLDADSEGLVVLTADGALQARIARPAPQARQDLLGAGRRHARRRRSSQRSRAASSLRDGPTRAGRRAHRSPSPRACGRAIRRSACARRFPTAWLAITLDEGRNRQVRRMTAAVGLPTLRLVRWSVGTWTLDGLARSGQMARRSRVL